MSPEQARGKAVDKRTDIWAFGCVLFEMLTGRPAFAGETVSDTIATILEREPDWRRAARGTPPGAASACCARCLEKDPKQRLRDIGDARIGLDADRTSSERAACAARREPLDVDNARRQSLSGGGRCVVARDGRRRTRSSALSARNPSGSLFVAPPGRVRFDFETTFLALSPDGSQWHSWPRPRTAPPHLAPAVSAVDPVR